MKETFMRFARLVAGAGGTNGPGRLAAGGAGRHDHGMIFRAVDAHPRYQSKARAKYFQMFLALLLEFCSRMNRRGPARFAALPVLALVFVTPNPQAIHADANSFGRK
jgi:hypothetical protein